MKVTYIHHSSFCVETEGTVFVFDYYNGKGVPGCEYHGKMPEFPGETQVYVFSSHSHRDHFDPEVLAWSRRYEKIYYIFAKEVKKKLGNSMLRRMGLGEEIREKITYVKPKETYKVGEVTVETLLSTDSGVAFLATGSGGSVYHAGDLNWWAWEEESEVFNRYQEATYKQQIDRLKDRPIDVSFVVVDPRLGKNQFLGLDYFLKQVKSGCVIPMHLWKHYEAPRAYLDLPEHQAFAERILTVEEENQVLYVQRRQERAKEA